MNPLLVLLLCCLAGPAAASGWERAVAPREWRFPADHGAHPAFRTEWWYLTGHLRDEDGGRYGYQVTFFRHGLAETPPTATNAGSAWRIRDVHFAHAAVTDVGRGTFRHAESVNRAALDRAGASEGWMNVWNGRWWLRGVRNEPFEAAVYAEAGGAALHLTVTAAKPLVLQGDRGLSRKSHEPGNASHYYSFPRLATEGTLVIDGRTRRVRGESWLDREFSTSALGKAQRGWDWFCLQLDDGTELMVYVMRQADGRSDAVSEAALFDSSGAARRYPNDAFRVTPLGTWRSPHTGATYPSGWRLEIPDAQCDLTVTPHVKDQELVLRAMGNLAYWEGACRVEGRSRGRAVRGNGYTELTGYAGDLGAAMR